MSIATRQGNLYNIYNMKITVQEVHVVDTSIQHELSELQ